jgi:hypothetical protein
MASYLLTCECGNSLKVDVGQAGGQVACSCGKRLDVPTLRNLRHLPQAKDDAPQTAAAWNARKGATSIFLILAGLLAALALWSRVTEPKLPVFDPATQSQFVDKGLVKLTPVQAWQVWTTEYRPLAERGFAVMDSREGPAIRARIARQRFLQTVMLIAAGVCAALAIIVAVLSRQSPHLPTSR